MPARISGRSKCPSSPGSRRRRSRRGCSTPRRRWSSPRTARSAAAGPDWPAADRVWRLVESEGVSILGLSPTLVRALIPQGAELVERHDLSSLRVLVTTGEPWNPEPYRWLFEHVGGGRCPIINCSGGTEVGACFLSPSPAVPIKACSLGRPALGLAMAVVDP